MSFEIKVLDKDRTTLFTYGPANPGGLGGPISAIVEPSGNCKELRFSGRNDELLIEAAHYIQLDLLVPDRKNVFFGPIDKMPEPNSMGDPNARDFTCVGGEALLDKRITREVLKEITLDLAEAAFEFATRYRELPLNLVAGDFINTGQTIQRLYRPSASLLDNMRRLASRAGFFVGVDGLGGIFFKPASGVHTLDYRDYVLQPLPIDNSNVVTLAQIVVAGGSTERVSPDAVTTLLPANGGGVLAARDYIPLPQKFDFEASIANGYAQDYHAQWGREKAFGLPDYLTEAPVLTPAAAWADVDPNSFFGENTNDDAGSGQAALYDENLSSYYFNNGAGRFRISFQMNKDGTLAGKGMGFHFAYATGTDFPGTVDFGIWYAVEDVPNSRIFGVKAIYRMPPTDNEIVNDFAIFLPDARMGPESTTGVGDFWISSISVTVEENILSAANQVHVYGLYPLVRDDAALTEIAQSNIELPQIAPQRITHKGYLEPRHEVVLNNAPAGNITLDAKRYQYTIDGRGLNTVIDLDNPRTDELGAAVASFTEAKLRRDGYSSLLGARG